MNFAEKALKRYKDAKGKLLYHMHNGLLHRYNLDYKQRFQALVIPVSYAKVVLKLAHDELGHNGTAQTYALIKRMFYWKGLKTQRIMSNPAISANNITYSKSGTLLGTLKYQRLLWTLFPWT